MQGFIGIRSGLILIRHKITISRSTCDGRKQTRQLETMTGDWTKRSSNLLIALFFVTGERRVMPLPLILRSNLVRSSYNRYYINYFPTFLSQQLWELKYRKKYLASFGIGLWIEINTSLLAIYSLFPF